MKISRLLVAHIVLWIGLCCLSVSATACNDVQWQLEAWEECPYAFEEPYLQYLQYGHYSEEILQRYKRMLSIIAMYGYAERLCFHLR